MSESSPAPVVLVVDDVRYVLTKYKVALQNKGWVVKVAQTCAAALAIIEAEMPSLVIVDLFLEDELGSDVVVATRRRSSTVPIVVITGCATLTNVMVAIRDGATAVVSKLKSVDHLLEVVAGAATAQPSRTGEPGLDSLAMLSEQHFLHMLEQCGGSKKAAAEALGVSVSTVKRRVKQFDWLAWDPDELDD